MLFFKTRELARNFFRKQPEKFELVDNGADSPICRRWAVKVTKK